MKNFILAVLVIIASVSFSYAAVDIQQDGTRINKSEKINFANGPTVTASGAVTVIDFDLLELYPVRKTSNPCATIGNGRIFVNNSTGVPCYCNGSNDYAIYSASTRCF